MRSPSKAKAKAKFHTRQEEAGRTLDPNRLSGIERKLSRKKRKKPCKWYDDSLTRQQKLLKRQHYLELLDGPHKRTSRSTKC